MNLSPIVVCVMHQLACLQLKEYEELDYYFIRAQDLSTKLEQSVEILSETLPNAIALKGSLESYEPFVLCGAGEFHSC